ncbi:MAG: PA0069 family radical SAM protein [Pseudomonadaceae bacterium]|nr:PA0069 family radical SAM protein [Pseudomonadaceae bacterium]
MAEHFNDRDNSPPSGTSGIEPAPSAQVFKGRGAVSNAASRYLDTHSVRVDDGWSNPDIGKPAPARQVLADRTRTLITRNRSPDISFGQSINPYKGCEHGCIYCFARPTHTYLDLSAGLDFETRLFYKTDVERLLAAELTKQARKGRCEVLAMGTNTDPYQPIEAEHKVTRRVLSKLLEYRQPVSIVTKSALILRDLDVLTELARHQLLHVYLSVTTLDNRLKAKLEPRTASGAARLRALATLSDAGIPCGVMAAPIIPAINDDEIESIVAAAADHGARCVRHIFLRLPQEVAPLFEQWLAEHYPDRAGKVMNIVRASRGGKAYDAAWGTRMRGTGAFADLIADRVAAACRRAGLPKPGQEGAMPLLRTDLLRVNGAQGELFDLPSRDA